MLQEQVIDAKHKAEEWSKMRGQATADAGTEPVPSRYSPPTVTKIYGGQRAAIVPRVTDASMSSFLPMTFYFLIVKVILRS